MSVLTGIITADTPDVRNTSLESVCTVLSASELLSECQALDVFRRSSENLYHRVRALFFLSAIHRYYLPAKISPTATGHVPFEGYKQLLRRRYEEAIRVFLNTQEKEGCSEATSSALAAAFRGLAFHTLAEQVRQSVRLIPGNQWMFRMGHVADYPLRVRPELLLRTDGMFPVLAERTPVRMDMSHSAWSDIFFLGMDFPEGARVLNISVDLAVCAGGVSNTPTPPVEAYLRIIDEPVLRLVSIDLEAQTDITSLDEAFDFARDYLGLLKAAVIASGLIPPGLEGSRQSFADLMAKLTGLQNGGLEIVSKVNEIPKGSRLAVSTNLLACLISACMRATNQISSLTGPLIESDRRIVAARAILGEWLGGSGGGWQDSGGVWPGIKLIEGVTSQKGDAEFGISRGRLLPNHSILGHDEVSEETRIRLQESLVLVHGGMAQDVGPVLEMVTEKYLLRSEEEWSGRQEAIHIFTEVVDSFRAGDLAAVGNATQCNFDGPIQTIIPWAANYYTQQLIDGVRQKFGSNFYGFWMLGGMAGGGMGFLFDPSVKENAQAWLATAMQKTKRDLESAVPFAMDPVVYDFAINEAGTVATMSTGSSALMPASFYLLMLPGRLRQQTRHLPAAQQAELDHFGRACRMRADLAKVAPMLIDRLVPSDISDAPDRAPELDELLHEYGFDAVQHEKVRADLRAGRIGLAQNALPASARIEDVPASEVLDARAGTPVVLTRLGENAIRSGTVAVVTLAGGVGSRWTRGAGVVKAINPFCRMGGEYRTFLEIQVATSRRVSRTHRAEIPHVFTTSYLTHAPILAHLEQRDWYGYRNNLYLSQGRSVGLRLIPMTRDLRFAWETMPQQMLEERKERVRDSLRAGLLQWALQAGEGSDYRDNVPTQCMHPVGHWYEIPNLLLNGQLAKLLTKLPSLQHVLIQNIDTLGAGIDASLLGAHINGKGAVTVEVIPRVADDRGGGLAKVDGKLRIVEGMAFPSEEIEFSLSFYNSGTMWIDIDRMLAVFGLKRNTLGDAVFVAEAVRRTAARMPTYVTVKDVKKRWGKGQEDVYPVTQFEKLWGDVTAMPEVDARFVVVPRSRGQQLKEVAQLDGWLRDGSAGLVESRCDWT